MHKYKLGGSSVWSTSQISTYLNTCVLPCRLASIDRNEFPQVTSMWFLYQKECIFLSARSKSLICSRVRRSDKVGFEVAGENPPYSGIRGRGRAVLLKSAEKPILEQLIMKYLKTTESSLAQWLLSKPQSESTIKIVPEWITSWDYSNRMN
jgi:nitroimidazol reductase NimA-like FMN-containing flavoprotein (pyridoxamine 5'-phosphate oxidase superfamily)